MTVVLCENAATEAQIAFLKDAKKRRKRKRCYCETFATFKPGGASGIGKGYALELAAEGFSIYIIDKNKGDCISAQREIKQLGVACDFMVYDFGVLGNAQEAEKFSADLK